MNPPCDKSCEWWFNTHKFEKPIIPQDYRYNSRYNDYECIVCGELALETENHNYVIEEENSGKTCNEIIIQKILK